MISETVASALQFVDDDRRRETRQFIRMIDLFFDALNAKNSLEGKLKRKPFHLPYYTPQDERFKVWPRTPHSRFFFLLLFFTSAGCEAACISVCM